MLEIVGNRCPVCGRFMRVVERTPIRTAWECTNAAVDHEWDGD